MRSGQRAVRMVQEWRRERHVASVVSTIPRQLGINKETLRNWVCRAEVDDGERPGTTTKRHEEIKAAAQAAG